MRGKYLFVSAVFVMMAVLVSCTLMNQQGSNQVVIQVSHDGSVYNADVVFAKDGLNGQWVELTGTNGIYTFDVTNQDGLYSIAVARSPINTYDATNVFFIHHTLSETNFVALNFHSRDVSHSATITVNLNLSSQYETMALFFLTRIMCCRINLNSNTLVFPNLPKGTGDLVIFLYDSSSIEPNKLAIIRNFALNSDTSITLTDSDFTNCEYHQSFQNIYLEYWLVGGKTRILPGLCKNGSLTYASDHKIPDALKQNNDLYVFRYDISPKIRYQVFRSSYPATAPFDPTAINPNPLPSTFAATDLTSGAFRVSINPYDSGLQGMNGAVYNFVAINYYIDPQGELRVERRYSVSISDGYLSKIANNYVLPTINLPAFQGCNADPGMNISIGKPFVVLHNLTLRQVYEPADGLILMTCMY
ncbi:MAG: hypothetical protein ACUVQF_09390 [Fervidobacterium sp.]|uniref:hypothetical protein n=1 Tax=Fervidobacterium sp. TaxID=1871331 RepID=UPI00404B3533